MEKLGPYQLVKRLGRGGMGTVYEGVDAISGQRAAVKVLAAPLCDDPGFRDRFDAEVEALRKLNHPGIVRLLGHGEQQGQVFYVMELVEGASLEAELQRGRRFDWREVAGIGIQMARALRHAHDRGIIHRDIKPGNLLFTPDGSVKLSDFGIARLFGSGRATGPGSVLGTVEYMAPEQAEGRPIDARADLYSLGCVLYALLARRPPYRASTLPEMLAMYRSCRPEPIGKFAPDAPEEFEKTVAQLLEYEAARRIASATVLSRRLEAMLDESVPLADTVASEIPDERGGAGPAGVGTPGRESAPLEARPALGPTPAMPPSERFPPSMHRGPPRAGPAEELPETRECTPAPPPPQRSEPEPSGSRFEPVHVHELDRVPHEAGSRGLMAPQTWALAIGFLLVGLSVWYLLQPLTADQLYDKIAGRTADGEIESLVQAEDLIRQFLLSFPKDSRSTTLRKQEREIQLYRLERKFDRRAAGLIRSETLLPVERDYLEAIHYARFDPQRAVRKLRAIVDLYDHRVDASGPIGQCLELVRRRLERLTEQIQQFAPRELEQLNDHLIEAEELFATDPARARAMCEAVIELYSDRPWAATLVGRARRDLEAHPAAKTGNSPGPKENGHR